MRALSLRSRRTLDLRWPERAFQLGACLVSQLGVLNHFTLDPFGFYTSSARRTSGAFSPPIGNADFYASFISAWRSQSRWVTFHAKSAREKAFALVSLVFVSFGTLVAGSDSAVLAILAIASAPLLVLSDAAALRRLVLGWSVFPLRVCLLATSDVLPSSTYLSAVVNRKLCQCRPTAAVCGRAALWLCAAQMPIRNGLRAQSVRMRSHSRARCCWLSSRSCCSTPCCVSAAAGRLERYLHFSASWGTDRGKDLTFVMQVYERMPFVQKLFGASSGGLFHADSVKPIFSDAALDTAHNEYLQYLVTNGALGLVCYLGAVFLALREGFAAARASRFIAG